MVDRPRRRTRAESREDNRQALLAAARQLIEEVGYSRAQLDEIAARAGLTKGAVYSIFGGKPGLFRAVVEEHARTFLPLLEWQFDVAPTVPAEELVEDLGRSYVRFLRTQDVIRLLAFELDLTGLALHDPDTLQLVQNHERALAQRLADALTGRRRRRGKPLTAEEAHVAADLVLGALGGLGQRMVTSPWMTWDDGVIAAALARLLPPGGGKNA